MCCVGFTALRNSDGLCLERQVKAERHFFLNDPACSALPRGQWGIGGVLEKVLKLQRRVVLSYVPQMQTALTVYGSELMMAYQN